MAVLAEAARVKARKDKIDSKRTKLSEVCYTPSLTVLFHILLYLQIAYT
jgi:hypothetical protein